MIGIGLGVKGSGVAPFSFGNALQFDGVNDFVSFSSITLGGELTAACWVNFNKLNASVSSDGTNNSFIFWNFTTAGASIRYIRIGGTALDRGFNTLLGTWAHLVVTRNASNVCTAYLNAAQQGSTNVISGNLILTGLSNNAGLIFGGSLDEFAIWNKALTASEVSTLYNGGNGADARTIQSTSLQRYYHMNEVSGTTLSDLINSANNGTLTNFDLSQCPWNGSGTCPWRPH